MNKYKELEDKYKKLEDNHKELNRKYDDLEDKCSTKIYKIKEDNSIELSRVKDKFDSEKKIYKNELDLKISLATKEYQDENIVLKNANDVLKTKNEILNKAFENMGFDVKDMKTILNKLVDGVVSKNKINLVK